MNTKYHFFVFMSIPAGRLDKAENLPTAHCDHNLTENIRKAGKSGKGPSYSGRSE
jgi:hypothetical protein